MKKRKIFNDSMLFSQQEMALLLGISRSQWAMFEIRERDIPGSAKVKLAALLQSSNELSFTKKNSLPHEKKQEAQKQELLQLQLQENKIRQSQLQQKLDKLEKKYKEAENTLRFVLFLREKHKLQEREALVLSTVEAKALAVLEKNGVPVQVKYRLQLDTLELQNRLLEGEKE